MRPRELAATMRRFADLIEALPSVDGLRLDLGEGFTLLGKSKAAARAKRYRDGKRAREHDPSRDDVTEKRNADRDEKRDDVTQQAGDLAGGVSSVAPSSSLGSKEIQVVENTDRLRAPASEPDTTTASTSRWKRTPGQPPLPRKELLPTPIKAHEWQPMPAHHDYAQELGLSAAQFDQLLIELRDKHGLRPHTRDWWDDRCNRFIEARGSKGPKVPGRLAPLVATDEDPVDLACRVAQAQREQAERDLAAHDAEQERLYNERQAAKDVH